MMVEIVRKRHVDGSTFENINGLFESLLQEAFV